MPIEIKEFIARKRLKGCSKGTIYQIADILKMDVLELLLPNNGITQS